MLMRQTFIVSLFLSVSSFYQQITAVLKRRAAQDMPADRIRSRNETSRLEALSISSSECLTRCAPQLYMSPLAREIGMNREGLYKTLL